MLQNIPFWNKKDIFSRKLFLCGRLCIAPGRATAWDYHELLVQSNLDFFSFVAWCFLLTIVCYVVWCMS